MKTVLLTIIFTGISLINLSQTNIDAIKKENLQLKDENKFLKKKLEFCTGINDTLLTIKPFSSTYDIKVVSCKGDRSNQSVEIEIVLSHQKINQQLSFDLQNSRIVDNIGTSYSVKIPNFYSSSGNYDVFMDTPLKITYIVSNVLPGTEMFKIIALKMNSNTIGQYSSPDLYTEIKNLRIVW